VSATGISLDIARELRSICSHENLAERPVGGVYVCPGSTEEAAEVLAFANQHHLSVAPAGGSTERSAAELRTDIVLHTSRLTDVEHYDHGDLTVGVGAGITISQLNEMVGADRLMFAGDPPCPERCTVGGLLATAAHGPLRHGYGGVRDYCIGVRFITGDGRRAKGGGRVVKNVAGYDLMKLLIGSYGTLAVITAASFKLFPSPRRTRTFLGEFATAGDALQFRDQILRSPLSPMSLELVSPAARKHMRPEMTDDAWVICVRAAGSDAVLARYHRELGAAITRELEGEAEVGMWRAIQNFGYAEQVSDTDGAGATGVICLSVWPRDVQDVVDALLKQSALAGVDVSLIGRVGVGLLLVRVSCKEAKATGINNLIVALERLFADKIAIKVKGAANPWPIAPTNLASMRAIKQALDPNNILRGRDIF
jgi:glycolate oxidase FAD binding subunit